VPDRWEWLHVLPALTILTDSFTSRRELCYCTNEIGGESKFGDGGEVEGSGRTTSFETGDLGMTSSKPSTSTATAHSRASELGSWAPRLVGAELRKLHTWSTHVGFPSGSRLAPYQPVGSVGFKPNEPRTVLILIITLKASGFSSAAPFPRCGAIVIPTSTRRIFVPAGAKMLTNGVRAAADTTPRAKIT
jgi:hypothetical protein